MPAQSKTESATMLSKSSLQGLPPFERAVCIIKFYEQFHINKLPYIGYGHRILPGEKLTQHLSYKQADSLLRSDLKKLCRLFRDYGQDSLLLATLAYNVGPYRILGTRNTPESQLLQKLKNGNRNITSDYLSYCRYKGKPIASIRRRRWMELNFLFHNNTK